MIKVQKMQGKGPLKRTEVPYYVKDEVKGKSAQKKQEIIDMISEGNQLTMLAVILEQIGDKVELDTPEFTQMKELFANIKTVLAK
jgi:hypothetical protein